MLRDSPIAALTEAHFEQPIVFTKTVLGPIAVVSDPAAIHRVLIENAANYRREAELPEGQADATRPENNPTGHFYGVNSGAKFLPEGSDK